jgi:hypothetical protein
MDQISAPDKETISRAARNNRVAICLTDSCALVFRFPGSPNFAATSELNPGFKALVPDGARLVSSLQQM